MDGLRAALAAIRPQLEAVEFLAPAAQQPARWQQLDRVRRLFASRLRQFDDRSRPPLVVVIGGTNVGKSTLFNLLLGEVITQPDALAAGTKSVALALPGDAVEAFCGPSFLPWFDKLPWSDPGALSASFEGSTPRLYWLARGNRQRYAFADTPDIDSTHLANHRATEDLFFQADAVLFVTSEQKYADEACDRYLAATARFGKTVAVVFNRAQPASEAFLDLIEAKLPAAGLPRQTTVFAVPVLPPEQRLPGDPPRPEVLAVRRWLEAVADGGEQVVATARLGAVRGFAEEWAASLADLTAEVSLVRAFASRCDELIEREVAADLPPNDLDDVDQAVLEALEELRVPGIDWVYEQLGVVRQRLLGSLRVVGVWLRQITGGAVRTVDQVAAESVEREQEHARVRLENLLAGLRQAAQDCPLDLRLAVLERLPDPAPEQRDAALRDYATQLAARRREIVVDAKTRIVAELRRDATKIRFFKGVTRTAAVAVSLTAAITAGSPGAHDLAVAPVADAATKWVLDSYLGQSWRERLEHEVAARRRALLGDGLRAATVAPFEARLPAAHRGDFLEQALAALQTLRHGVPGDAR